VTDVARGYGEGTYGSGRYGYGRVPAAPTIDLEVWTPAGWVDVSCDGRTVDVQRGRSSWTESFAAATAVVELANFAGIYSAWNPRGIWATSSPYRTGVPVRYGVITPDGVRHPLFTCTTDNVTDTWPDTVDAVATVTATDAFKLLARAQGVARAPVGDGERTGARIGRLLAAAGYTGPQTLDAGTVTMQSTDLAGVALDLMRVTGETEWGWVYVDESGTVRFRQRDAVQTDPRMVNVQWTFVDDDSTAGVCYSDISLPTDSDAVVNIAQITPPGLPTQTATDTASTAWFGPRTYTRTDLPYKVAADAAATCQLIVLEQAAQERRIDAVTFDVADPAGMAAAVGVRLNDRVRVIRHFPGGYVLDAELLVNSVHHRITATGTPEVSAWSVQLGTADALMVRDYGQWDVAGCDVATDQWGV